MSASDVGDGIRPATIEDMPRLMEYARRFHEQSCQPFPFDEDATARMGEIMIEAPQSTIIIGEAGMIGGALCPAYCAPDWVQAVELFWWAEKGGIALLKAFEDWAQEVGASEVRMTTLAALERADRLLRGLSYEPAEISYRKVL
ncbi:MAG: hypothetical protein AB3N21_13765 [Ruegeria sp.]|uniref:hypothetical protein n=1 Tax=Ruegeria sp. TaxID=1879320 RepID=UPI00349E9C93